MALIQHGSLMYSSELEGNLALAFRAFDGSTYEVRRAIAKYLAALIVASQSRHVYVIRFDSTKGLVQ
jgi:hypothetical protein